MAWEQFFQNASPEQLIFWEQVKSKVGYNQISPFFYQGANIGEFSTYNANKLYFALDLTFEFNASTAAGAYVEFFDENNIDNGIHANFAPYWDGTAAALKGYANTLTIKNFYFSRYILSGYTYIKFIGFKSLI